MLPSQHIHGSTILYQNIILLSIRTLYTYFYEDFISMHHSETLTLLKDYIKKI